MRQDRILHVGILLLVQPSCLVNSSEPGAIPYQLAGALVSANGNDGVWLASQRGPEEAPCALNPICLESR